MLQLPAWRALCSCGLQVLDISKAKVYGLEGLTYLDKVPSCPSSSLTLESALANPMPQSACTWTAGTPFCLFHTSGPGSGGPAPVPYRSLHALISPCATASSGSIPSSRTATGCKGQRMPQTFQDANKLPSAKEEREFVNELSRSLS